MFEYVGRTTVAVALVAIILANVVNARDHLTKHVQGLSRDILGEQELAAPGDPSFESVARHFPAMKHPREAIGVKDGPSEFIVRPDGSIQFNGMKSRPGYLPVSKIEHLFFEVGDPAIRLGRGECPCSKRLLENYLPIVIAEYEHDGLKYEQTAFGWSPGMKPEAPLMAYLRLRISNPGSENRTESIRCRIQLGNSVKTAAAWKLAVDAETEQSIYIKAPSIGVATGTTKGSSAEFDKHLAEAVASWKGILSKGMKISVPQQRVNDAYRAWLAYNFLMVDKRGDVYEPHDGSGGYEAVFGYSAALYCHALDMAGYHEEAQLYLDSLGTFVSPEGLFVVNFGLTDTGTLLFAMNQHYRLTGDETWLRKTAPTMIAMCNWIINKREEVMAGQGKDSAVYGLIKYRPYCDHPKPTYCYLTDTYLCTGMQSAAEALRAAGMDEQSARIRGESEAYRRDILRSMNCSAVERNGVRLLPIFPETQDLLKDAGYYSLLAGMVLETDFLSHSDEQARLLIDPMERRNGLVLGMCQFRGGIDHAYTYGYWMNCLQRDRVKRVLLGFYGSLAYGMTRETYSAVEVTGLRSGKNEPTLPHLYSNTQQLRLLRNMLLREDGDALLIGQAIPRPWLADGKKIEIADAPTAFGTLGYAIDSHVDDGWITVQIDPPTRKPPKVINLRLRHPRNEPIKAVTVNGVAIEDFTVDTVALKNLKGRSVVEVRYK